MASEQSSGRPPRPAEGPAETRRPEGQWDRLALQVPASLAERFRELAHSEEHQRGVKLAGTAAAALWVGLPARVRQPLLDWAAQVERNPDLAESPEAAATVFATILRSLIELRGASGPTESKPVTATPQEDTGWFVDRILDPQVLLQQRDRDRTDEASRTA